MSFLRNVWYQAGWAEELPHRGALARRILDTPLLFFRDGAGTPCAILDRCPHRFAPLSAGRVEGGVVTCGYHGLAFDGSGRCVHNPHGPIVDAIRVPSYKVVERHLALWIWMGDPTRADPARIPDLSFIDETATTARITGNIPTRANYQLVVDNIMDLSHADYVHPTTLGGMMQSATTKVRAEGEQIIVEYFARNCDPPPGFQHVVAPPEKADIWIDVSWRPAGVMVLVAEAKPTGEPRSPGKGGPSLHSMTPETASTTHYFYFSGRRSRTEDAALTASLKILFEKAFVDEDKPILEKQQAAIGNADFATLKPALLPVDAAAVKVRRKLAQLLALEAETAPARTDS